MSRLEFDLSSPGCDPGRAPHAARVSLLIVSPVRLYREGLALSLAQRPDLDVMGAAGPGASAVADAARLAPGAVLLDVSADDGPGLAGALRRAAPLTRLIAFAIGHHGHELLAYAEAGVTGFVAEDSAVDDLVAAVGAVMRGEIFCSPRMAAIFVRNAAVQSRLRALGEEFASLTQRERDVARLLAQGRSNKEIAIALSIGPATVKNHVHSILDKLQVRRRGEAAALWRASPAAPAASAEARA